MPAVLHWLLRLICYGALVIVLAGLASLVFVTEMGVCPSLDESQIACSAPFYERIASFGMSVVLISVFTGLPGLLAIAGLVMLGYDVGNLLSRSKSR